MQGPKIVWGHFANERSFSFDPSGSYLNNKCFFLPGSAHELCAMLNSRVFWSGLSALARIKRGNYFEAEAQYVEQLPIPDLGKKARSRLSTLGQACTIAARARFAIQSAVRRRILDLAPPEKRKLNGRLENWHSLDFAAFRKGVKTAFRADIPLKERGEWEAYLGENGREVASLTAEIAAAEAEIDRLVYAAFDLMPDEVALLEASLEGQY